MLKKKQISNKITKEWNFLHEWNKWNTNYCAYGKISYRNSFIKFSGNFADGAILASTCQCINPFYQTTCSVFCCCMEVFCLSDGHRQNRKSEYEIHPRQIWFCDHKANSTNFIVLVYTKSQKSFRRLRFKRHLPKCRGRICSAIITHNEITRNLF